MSPKARLVNQMNDEAENKAQLYKRFTHIWNQVSMPRTTTLKPVIERKKSKQLRDK